MGFFSGYYPVKNRLVVISGGSQGLGASLAKLIVNQGGSVVIVARTVGKLQQTVEECEKLRTSSTQTISYVSADLSKAADCARVFTEIEKTPDIVMCCAGVARPGLLLETSPEVLESSIDSIYKSALYFSQAALKAIAAAPIEKNSPPRHITFFSSVVAFYGFIGYGSYAPLKSAVRVLADILRQECIPYNTNVECVFPGNIDTEGFEIEEHTKPEITKMIEGPSDVMDPDECAALVLKRLDAGQEMVHTDLIGWVLNGIVLGASPRTSPILLSILSLVLTLLIPIWNIIVNRDIRSYYKNKGLKESEKKKK